MIIVAKYITHANLDLTYLLLLCFNANHIIIMTIIAEIIITTTNTVTIMIIMSSVPPTPV